MRAMEATKPRSHEATKGARGGSTLNPQSSILLAALCAVALLAGGCMPDMVKMFEVQAQQQNALVTSVTEKIQWDNVSAILDSRLNNPRLTINALYVQGVVIDVVTNGVSSSLNQSSSGASAAPNDAATAERIQAILSSSLPASVKEQLVAELLETLLQSSGTLEGGEQPGASAPGGEPEIPTTLPADESG